MEAVECLSWYWVDAWKLAPDSPNPENLLAGLF